MAADDTWVHVEASLEITDEMNAGSASNCDAVQRQSTEVIEANSDEEPIVDKPPNVAEETTPVTQTSKAPGFFADFWNKFCGSGSG